MCGRCGRPRPGSGRRRRPRFPRTSGRPVASGRGYRLRIGPMAAPDPAGAPRRAPGRRAGDPMPPRDWVGSRTVPSDKRARQRAAREARLAAEAQRQKRRKQIRNGVIIVVVVRGDHRDRLRRLERQQQATPCHDDVQGRPRQAAGQGERGRGEGGLPGQHQDHGEHPEVPVSAGHDDRHVQDLHRHGRDHHGHLRHHARRQDGARRRSTTSCSWPTRATTTA